MFVPSATQQLCIRIRTCIQSSPQTPGASEEAPTVPRQEAGGYPNQKCSGPHTHNAAANSDGSLDSAMPTSLN